MQPRHQATLTEPAQCILQHDVANPHVSTHMATPDDNNHAAIPMGSATTDSINAYRTTHTGTNTLCRTQRRNRLTSKRSKPQPPHTGGTFHRRLQPQPPHTGGTFHRRLQPHYTEKHKVSCSGFLPNTSPMQHSFSHSNATTSLPHHFPSSHIVTTSVIGHQFPSSPLPIVTTSLPHHFPSSPHSPRHHFPSPLPFVTTLCHSLLFFCDVLLCDVKSHTALVIAYYSFVMYCYICDVKSHTALHQCQVSQFYLSVTRKYCFPTSFDYSVLWWGTCHV